jgi:cytoskeletal protein CcmA (bactofilin family)
MSKWGQKESSDFSLGEISTLLGKDAEVRGSIKTHGSMRIDGSVIGELTSTKTVTVGATGNVDGDISAENIIVAGRVKGSLTAKGRIALESTARLEGDVHATRLSITEGANFRGRSNMGDKKTVPFDVETADVSENGNGLVKTSVA